MPSAVRLREDYSVEELRALARRSKTVNQSRRLLSLAAVRDGMDRGAAAKVGGMDRQTLRDWVHRFNALGPEGLIDNWTQGPKPRLSAEQLAEVAQIVEAGPDREKDGVVRWRRIDLKRVIAERFGVEFHERYVGKLLKTLGFSHISARPRHPAQDERIVEAFKNVWPAPSAREFSRSAADQSASTYPASRISSGHDGDTHAPVLINFPASTAPFFKPGFRSAVRLSGHLVVTLSQTPVDRGRFERDRPSSRPPSAFLWQQTVLHAGAPPRQSSPACWRRRRP